MVAKKMTTPSTENTKESTPKTTAAKPPATPTAKKVVKKVAAPAPVVAAPIVNEVVVAAGGGDEEVVEEKNEENELMEVSAVFFAKLQQLGGLLTAIKTEYRVIEKKWTRVIKQSQKAAKKKRKVGNRAPSGFVKAARISDELADFLGVDKGVEMARTDVTKEITAYVKEHKLQDKDNGRQINPDAKLKKLLHLTSEDVLSYFNLQKFMSPHFHKKSDDVAAV